MSYKYLHIKEYTHILRFVVTDKFVIDKTQKTVTTIEYNIDLMRKNRIPLGGITFHLIEV